MRTHRRGVSEVTAILLLIIITVFLGAVVYAWAAEVFSGADSIFSQVYGTGVDISQNVVLNHVAWYTNGTDSLYLTNNGAGPAIITNIEVENESTNALVPTTFSLPITILPGASASTSFFMPAHDNSVYFVTVVTTIGGTFTATFQRPCPLSASGVYECQEGS
jgi:hypothetical protein